MVRTVVTVGMHRSGTSLAARLVNLVGVDLGPPEQLMEAKADNPRGFWENVPIYQLQRRMLRYLGGTWDAPPPTLPGWEQHRSLDRFRDDARQTLEEVFGDLAADRCIGWKDPRTSLLLPFWRTVLPVDRVVLVVRDPIEVISSLAQRNGLDPEASARLWLRYHLTAQRDAPNALVLDYEDLLTDVDTGVQQLTEYTGLQGPTRDGWHEIRTFVDPALRSRPRVHHDDHGPTVSLATAVYRGEEGAWDAAREVLLDGIQALATVQAVGPLPGVTARRFRRLRDATKASRAATTNPNPGGPDVRSARERSKAPTPAPAPEHTGRTPTKHRERLTDRARILAASAKGRAKARRRAASHRASTVRPVVLNYGRWQDTLSCVASLVRGGVARSHIVLVDNPTAGERADDLQARANAVPRELRDLEIIFNERNRGYAGGNNVGIRRALETGTDFVWLVNPDCQVAPDALTRLLQAAQQHSDAAILGPRILWGKPDEPAPRKIWFDGGLIRWDDGVAVKHLNSGARADEVAPELIETDYVTGACLLIRTPAIHRLGLMPEEYFLYFEETDLCTRAWEAGMRVLVEQRATAFHDKRSSGSLPEPYFIYYYTRNRLVFADRFSPGRQAEVEQHLRDHWLMSWDRKIGRAAPEWLPQFEELASMAIADAAEGRLGRRPEVERIPSPRAR
jgi:GT2 family glycosyltransferase